MQLLIRGSIGPKVKELQKKLRELGYTDVIIDGTYGATVEAAVMAFQESQGLAADGSYGPDTHAAMEEALAAAEGEEEGGGEEGA